MLGGVSVAGPGRQFFVNTGNTCWTIGCDLLANAEMQSHVEKWVGLPVFRRVVLIQHIAANGVMIFRM